MPYRLKFEHPNAGEGSQLYIMGLGAFENGKSYDVTDEEADAFRLAHATYDQDTDPEGQLSPVTQVLGPSLEEADLFGVTVTKAGSDSPNTSNVPTGEVVP